MKISIITATYNSSKTIEDCIASVNNQTYSDIEHIIIDGASMDDTVEIIESISNVNTKLISEPDNGIYDALNKAIRMAKGDIIGLLHSDDIYPTIETIEEILNVFKTKDVDGVYGDLVYVNRENPNKVIRYWKSKPFNNNNLKYGWMPAHPTLFLKKEVYQKHGCFELDFKIAADYDFMLRILNDLDLRFEYLPRIITKMRVGGASNKSLKNIIQKSKEDLNTIQKNEVGGIHTLFLKNARKIIQFIHNI